MKENRLKIILICFVLGSLILLDSMGLFVATANASGSCQYCAWNNATQEYECKWYEGPGYFLCDAEGTDCSGHSPCYVYP